MATTEPKSSTSKGDNMSTENSNSENLFSMFCPVEWASINPIRIGNTDAKWWKHFEDTLLRIDKILKNLDEEGYQRIFKDDNIAILKELLEHEVNIQTCFGQNKERSILDLAKTLNADRCYAHLKELGALPAKSQINKSSEYR
jgi:hypothetical protein